MTAVNRKPQLENQRNKFDQQFVSTKSKQYVIGVARKMNKLTVNTDIALKAPQLSTRAIGVTIANEETATVVTS